AKAELAGIEREYNALARDRDARAKREKGRAGLPAALDRVSVEKGYERALAAVLGRDAKSPLGTPEAGSEGRFWSGSEPPQAVADSLLAQVTDCPAELAARLALVHVAQDDDGRALAPGEWLVTIAGHLRRWDGFLARGEGSAEAARLEAANRLAELEGQLPALRSAAEEAGARETAAREELSALQSALVALERDLAGAIEAERQAWRALDQAEAAKERVAARLAELEDSEGELADQLVSAREELEAARAKRAELPSPDAGRAALEAAQAKNEAARSAVQATLAELASHDQSLAGARERLAAQKPDHASWQARSSDAARRMAEADRRLEEIEEEYAVIAATPETLRTEIEQGDAVRERLAKELADAEQAMQVAQDALGDVE
ncbi:MAG: hypothetical protein RIC82_05305, partial [Parvibaculum sp.]